jgi:cytochrome c oxidase accessory protein FixG
MARIHLPTVQGTGSLLADGSRPRIIPADVTGRYTWARRLAGVLLVAFAGSLPWVHVRGAPALFLDIGTRRLFAFGSTFNAQDGAFLFFLLSGLGFALVLVTTLFGRLWCGWTCPQTVLLDVIFRPIERWVEGSREARLRREVGPWDASRILRLVAKHALFALVSVALAHAALAYFVTAPGVFALVQGAPGRHLEAFAWTTALSVLLYADLALFREQLCLGVCPYGRLQGALVDDDTVTVGYDARRGEPRGKAGHVEGDCLDCHRCVVVCPTGIDIRNGSQLDCVACAACVDACDDIMVRAHRLPGLIRYDSIAGFAGKSRRLVRPRVVLYVGLLLVGAAVALVTIRGRHTDAELFVMRLPGAPYQVDGDLVRNAFDAHIVSKRATKGVYALTVEAPPGADVVLPLRELTLEGMGSAHVPLFVTVSRRLPSPHPVVRLHAVREGSSEVVSSEVPLLGVLP